MRFHLSVATLSVLMVVALSFAPASADLVGYWNFNAGNAADSSGNNNHGTAGASITYPTDVPFGSGRSGQSNGTGGANVVTVATSPTLESIDDQLTIAFWMKAVPGANWVRLFQHGTEASGDRTWLVDRYSNLNYTNVRVDTTGAFNQNIATGGADTFTNPATWHHLVYVLDNGTWRKYVDGVQSNGTYNHGDGLYNTRPLYIFGRNGTGEYVGQLDDIGLWNNPLTPAQARSIFTVPTTFNLDYDLGDVMTLWTIYAMGGGGGGSIEGIPWQYVSSLPGSPNPGDAFVYNNIMYIALGSGTGLAAIPEPSTLALGLLALFGLALCRRRWRQPR